MRAPASVSQNVVLQQPLLLYPGGGDVMDVKKVGSNLCSARLAPCGLPQACPQASGSLRPSTSWAAPAGHNGPRALRRIPEKALIALGAAEIGSGRPYVGVHPVPGSAGWAGSRGGPGGHLGHGRAVAEAAQEIAAAGRQGICVIRYNICFSNNNQLSKAWFRHRV